jgi:hypothetical protein
VSDGRDYFAEMPLDLALSTNTPTATLELRQAQPLGDLRHLAAFLIVRSGAFAAALPFVFTRAGLMTFADSLDVLCRETEGVAHLAARESEDVVRFTATRAGQLRIEGNLHETEDAGQHLQFSFMAEWEGVPPFAAGIRQLIADTA